MKITKKICVLFFSVIFYFASQNIQAASLELIFNDDSGKPVSNVVAALISDTKTSYSEKAKAVMDQRNNTFVPGVLAVRVNTLVYFPNSDNIRHQVYSFSPTKRFELRLYHGLTAEPVLFDQVGQVVLGCNIHDSMLGYIYVVDSEYFGVSDNLGKIILKNIPAGKYTLQIQYPKLLNPYPEKKIVFTADQSLDQKIVLSGFVVEKKNDQNDLDNLFK